MMMAFSTGNRHRQTSQLGDDLFGGKKITAIEKKSTDANLLGPEAENDSSVFPARQ